MVATAERDSRYVVITCDRGADKIAVADVARQTLSISKRSHGRRLWREFGLDEIVMMLDPKGTTYQRVGTGA